MMAAQHFNQESDLIAALTAYTQADADGVMVKVSRQACDEAAERIAALERDLAAAQAERDTALTDTHDRIADLEAEAAALRVNAERYRWLRDDCSDDQFEALSGKWKWDELDAAIDAAKEGGNG